MIAPIQAHERGFYSPILWVRITRGGVRLTIDLRLLNGYLRPWRSAQEGVVPTLRRVPVDWRWYSTLDVRLGFFHIPIAEDLQSLFFFEFEDRQYKFSVLPMGWSTSPGPFSDRLKRVLAPTCAISYVDDVIVGGSTANEHDFALRRVFDQCRKYGIHIAPDKVQIARRSVKFLGFDLESGSFHLSSYVRDQMAQLPKATTTTQIRRMLGIFNVLRPVCPDLAKHLEPLQREMA